MAKRPFKNPYSLHCFSRVEEVLNNEAGFATYLDDYTRYRLSRSPRTVKISRFSKAVIFELGTRSLAAIECSKVEVLNAAITVKQQWPHVPVMEPTRGNGIEGNGELYVSLKISLSALEARKVEIERNIKSHKKAIAALAK